MDYLMRRMTKALLVATVSSTVLAGCEVTNPGPVQDEFLAQAASQQGLVNGAARRYAELLYLAYTGAILSQEVFPGGQTGAFGHDVLLQGGEVVDGSFGGYFNDAVQARFIAETAIKRFTDVGAADNMLYQAHMWAGFAYRTLGENWCDAVIGSTDPDDPTPGSFEAGTDTYFTRAITNFDAAQTFAASADQTNTVRGARAAANAYLGNWGAVTTDAAAVPDDFVFASNMDSSEQAIYNAVYWANAFNPYAAYTMDFTWWKAEYTASGDPRIPWFDDLVDNPFANAALSGYGPVPWSNQMKYTSRDDDVNMVSGWEMRLLEAESLLQQNAAANFGAATGLINQVRTRNISDLDGVTPLAPVVTADGTEAWTALKRERGIELWLEGRRMGDLKRWIADGTPGDNLQEDWTAFSNIFLPAAQRDLCFDIPTAERESNENVPDVR